MRLGPGDQVRRPAGLGLSPSGDGLEPGLSFRLWVFIRPIRPVHRPLALYLLWHLAPHRESTPPILQCRIFPWEWLRDPGPLLLPSKQHYEGVGQKPSLPLSSQQAVVTPWIRSEIGVWVKADKERKQLVCPCSFPSRHCASHSVCVISSHSYNNP